MMRMIKDWYIMLHISLFGFGVLGYAYKFPSPAVFGTACGALTTVIGMYHWFTKVSNASNPP